jgi:glycosidase
LLPAPGTSANPYLEGFCRFYPLPMLDVCDISNFCDVDPLFSTLSVFDELLARLHARSIKLLPDVVP